ncbi:MAG TPA: acyl-ACP thioesterase domain-containing protein, partial [Chitinophagales bacterium]
MSKYFEKTYELRYFEMDKFGIASPVAIVTLLEETAAEHCLHINHSLYDLESQNIGWVLVSGAIEMIKYPKYKDKITIRTWLSKYSLVKGYRENIIYNDKGEIIGLAKGLWVFYDIKRRRPVSIYETIKSAWDCDNRISTTINIDTKIRPIIHHPLKVEFNVYELDIDGNKHVNNIRYLHWLMESLPKELVDNYYMKTINCRFIAEANYGEKIEVFIDEQGPEKDFAHIIKTDSGKICATATSQW